MFLHRFLASDPDRGLHDHPWGRSASLIVCGSYLEKRLVSKGGEVWMSIRRLKAGMVNWIGGNDFHQIVVEEGVPVWTIFYHGPRSKTWGFAVNRKSASMEAGPYGRSDYDEVTDVDRDVRWELSAPRGRKMPGRMPSNYCLVKRGEGP